MNGESTMSFWEHLDVLRGVLLRCASLAAVCAVVAFACGEALFDFVLAPAHDNFLIYRLFGLFGADNDNFHIALINTGLARQFLAHVTVAGYVGLIAASPYIVYALLRFVEPALYRRERRYAFWAVGGGYAMFLIGAAVSYLLIFPLTFRFLGTYQVSAEVPNFITLDSYLDTLTMLCLLMGVMFELPIVAVVLARLGLLNALQMRRLRRHAIVGILVATAIITPSGDIFTLCVTGLPIILLYELSIRLVARAALQNEIIHSTN